MVSVFLLMPLKGAKPSKKKKTAVFSKSSLTFPKPEFRLMYVGVKSCFFNASLAVLTLNYVFPALSFRCWFVNILLSSVQATDITTCIPNIHVLCRQTFSSVSVENCRATEVDLVQEQASCNPFSYSTKSLFILTRILAPRGKKRPKE